MGKMLFLTAIPEKLSPYFFHLLRVSIVLVLKKLPPKGNLAVGVSLLDCGSQEDTTMV